MGRPDASRVPLQRQSVPAVPGHQAAPAALPKDIRDAQPPSKKKNVYDKDVPDELRDELWNRFRAGVEPLRAAGKLTALHFQFAPWMAFHTENMRQIETCQAQLPGYQLAVEFRNKTWFEGKHEAMTLAFERERGLANVIVDEPQGFPDCIPPIWEVTTPAQAIVRMHGRNHETWNAMGWNRRRTGSTITTTPRNWKTWPSGFGRSRRRIEG